MVERPEPIGQKDFLERERIRYQWMLESIAKFRLFFVGLVFAILAFSVQFSVSGGPWVQILQGVAWILLLVTSVLALRDAGGLVLKHTEVVFEGLKGKLRVTMWTTFLVAIVLLGIARLL